MTQPLRFVVLALVALAACVTASSGQTTRRTCGDQRLPPTNDLTGYESLPSQWRSLLGPARESKTYATLTESQRATYEAIFHALDDRGLLARIMHQGTRSM